MSDPPSDDRTWDLIKKHIDADGSFRICPMAPEDEVVTPAVLEAVATRAGVRFPAEFAAHVCGAFPGVGIEVKEEFWPRPRRFEVAPFWTFLYGFHTLTPCPASEDWMRIDFNADRLFKATGLVAAPILQILSDPGFYCVDRDGRICLYDHQCKALDPIEGDFWTLFEQQLAALAERKRDRGSLPTQS